MKERMDMLMVIFLVVGNGMIYHFNNKLGTITMFGVIILMLTIINFRLQRGDYKPGNWK